MQPSLQLKRLIDLSRQADKRNMPMFSDFLTLAEAEELRYNTHLLSTASCLYGGYEDAERQMAVFVPDAFSMDEITYPIRILRFTPKSAKFAEALTHRDVLGSLMGLGIERQLLGDILVEDQVFHVIAEDRIADFLLQEFKRARHTDLTGGEESAPLSLHRKTEQGQCIIAANRLDAFVAALTGKSRAHAQELIQSGAVSLNGIEEQRRDRVLAEKTVISIRGTGKFRFLSISGVTKKSRIVVNYEKYC